MNCKITSSKSYPFWGRRRYRSFSSLHLALHVESHRSIGSCVRSPKCQNGTPSAHPGQKNEKQRAIHLSLKKQKFNSKRFQCCFFLQNCFCSQLMEVFQNLLHHIRLEIERGPYFCQKKKKKTKKRTAFLRLSGRSSQLL